MDLQALSDVLFALVAAREHQMPGLGRTAVQRLLFLAAVLYPLTGKEWGYTFSTARFGPFNQFVNQAADQLALQGLCAFTDFGVKTDGNIRAVYSVTHFGITQAHRITKIRSQQHRFDWIQVVVAVLDIYGHSVIPKIATR